MMLHCEPLNHPETETKTQSTTLAWRVFLPSGESILWQGFYTGPIIFSQEEINAFALELLGLNLDEIASVATTEIHSYVSQEDECRPAIIIHGATPTTKGFEGDLNDVRLNRHAYDCAAYLETRAVYLARGGDLALGRTSSWKEFVQLADIESIDIGRTDYYYLSQALLVAAVEHCKNPLPELTYLIDRLRNQPDSLIRLYALDTEIQIFLLWVKRQAHVNVLNVDVNSPQVAIFWNQKGPIHPKIKDILKLDGQFKNLSPYKLLSVEQRHSKLYQELEITIPVLPGYTIERKYKQLDEFLWQLTQAARRLKERYGLQFGCLKPTEAGDGARIVLRIDLNDEAHLQLLGESAYEHGDDYLLEAHVEFCTFHVDERSFIVAPSGHIRFGHIADGLTIQLMKGTAWEGNAYIDEYTCGSFGIQTNHYHIMRAAMYSVIEGFQGKGLVTGGIDFAVGRIGGNFGDDILIAVSDLNFSSHGAEYMRRFLDKTRTNSRTSTKQPNQQKKVYVASKVFIPSQKAKLKVVRNTIESNHCGAEIITCVPNRWGMLATIGKNPKDAIHNVLSIENKLKEQGFIVSL